jgi:hypothetical protein
LFFKTKATEYPLTNGVFCYIIAKNNRMAMIRRIRPMHFPERKNVLLKILLLATSVAFAGAERRL